MSPLPSSRVIPTGWSGHHRGVARGGMTATCRLEQAGTGEGAWNENTQSTDPPAPTTSWSGPCRVQAQPTQAQDAESAGQQVTTRTYLVAVPLHAVLPEAGVNGGRVVVTACEDPTLLDRPLRIADITRGSLLWERDLVCVDDLQ